MIVPWNDLSLEELAEMLLPDPVDLYELTDDLGWSPEPEPESITNDE